MYLTRLRLNPLSRGVRRDLADPQRMHRTVMCGFPDGDPAAEVDGEPARARHGVLYRLDVEPRAGRITLYVQSTTRPDYAALPLGTLVEDQDGAPNPATARGGEPEA